MNSYLYFPKPHLKTHQIQPENQETPIEFISTDRVPNTLFYRRNHFSYPQLPSRNYWLPINGLVQRHIAFSLHDLYSLPSKEYELVLECAGNKRSLFEPKLFGEQWEKGAMSQGKWRGVSLKVLLDFAGIHKESKEVIVEGYDYGNRTDDDHVYSYARSLPLDKALHPDTLIAYEYNDEPIPFQHGFPLRLIVPGWYAMASVKWIKQIYVSHTSFKGPFQSNDYIYYPNKENNEGSYPVTINHVNSTIQSPLSMEILNTGVHLIRGIAWTGADRITKVEISLDNGAAWESAVLENSSKKDYGWYSWTYRWDASIEREYVIQSRATDSNNRVQPINPIWNRKGYGYNAVDKIKVIVE